MGNEKYKSTLLTFAEAYAEYLSEAKQNYTDDNNEFNTGYLMAFHRVTTLLQQQAELFELDLKELNLEKINDDYFS
jgi:hypothetical protein